jgi:hypothetical protein
VELKMSIKEKLKEHIIDKKVAKWNIKMVNVDGEEVEVPHTLEGEILLDTDIDETGRVKGWITIPVEGIESIMNRRDNPMLRNDELADNPKFNGRNMRNLSPSEFEELTGHKKWLDKWRKEGIEI